MSVAILTTACSSSLAETHGLLGSLEDVAPALARHVLAAADVVAPPGAEPLPAADFGPAGVHLPDVLDSTDQVLCALPFALRHLLDHHEAVIVALPGLIASRSPEELVDAVAGQSLALTTVGSVIADHHDTPALDAAVNTPGMLSPLLFVASPDAGSLIDRWCDVMADSFRSVLQVSPHALYEPALRSMLAADGVSVAPGSTLLRFEQMAAIEAGRASGAAPAFVDCTDVWAAVRRSTDGEDEAIVAPNSAWLGDTLHRIRAAIDTTPPTTIRSPDDRLILEARRSADPYGERWEHGSDEAFLRWLDERDGSGLSRLEHLMWAGRPALRDQILDPLSEVPSVQAALTEGGTDLKPWSRARDAFAWRWQAVRHVVPGAEARADKRLNRVFTSESSRYGESRQPFGGSTTPWTIIGPFRSENGLGQAARGTIAALEGPHPTLSYIDTSDAYASRNAAEVDLGSMRFGAFGDLNIMHANPAELLAWRDDVFARRLAGRYNAAMWFWETTSLPDEYLPAFGMVDELWAASRYLVDVFSAYQQVPVHHTGLAVSLPDAPTHLDRSDFGLEPDDFVFLFVFDAMSSHGRKNPDLAVEAFARATEGHPGRARLIVKASNLSHYPASRQTLVERVAATPGASLIESHFDRRRLLALMATADVYLSLHASEGYGLTILESMALATPAICTGYSGNMDFTTEENAWLVRHRLAETTEARGPYPAGTVWAQPDVEHAAALIRSVLDDPGAVAAKGERAREAARAVTDPSRYRSAILERLEAVSRA